MLDNDDLDMNINDVPQAAIGFRETLKIPEGVKVESSGAEEVDTETPEQQDEENVALNRRSQRVKLVLKIQKNYTGGEELDEILDKLKSLSPRARKIKQMRAKYRKN